MLVFDTSAFINGWRVHYPPQTFPSVWTLIATAIADSRIVVPYTVYEELGNQDDDVWAWAKTHARSYVEPSEEVQRLVGAIQALLPNPGVRDIADPFVIAEAKVRGFTVVTYEGTNTMTGRRTRNWDARMPGICEAHNVPCRILPEALEMLSALF